jgi:hypothetical protein
MTFSRSVFPPILRKVNSSMMHCRIARDQGRGGVNKRFIRREAAVPNGVGPQCKYPEPLCEGWAGKNDDLLATSQKDREAGQLL